MSEITSEVLQLEVTPLRALVDESVSVKLSGLSSGKTVTLWARTRDANDREWASSASFIADDNGVVDVTKQQPITGSYHTIDSMGLFWSMLPVNSKQPIPFIPKAQQSLMLDLIAEIDGKAIASSQIERRFATNNIVREPLHEQGLVGTCYYPGDGEWHPAIIILSGSDGKIRENQASLLASHGYVALTLVYFGAAGIEGLPQNLVHIPLEYFETAIHWLQAQSFVNSDKIGVIGLSRGGELVLLLGSVFPEIKAVVAGSPSGLVNAGIDGRDYSKSAWTYHGKPLQQVSVKVTPLVVLKLWWNSIKQKSFSMRDMFMTTLNDRKHLEEATIRVESINGPVLLISGDDDQMWPSTPFSEQVMKRLKEYHHPYSDEHLHYPGAGHFVCFPYGFPGLPPAVKRIQGMAVGGGVEATAASVADSWPKILAFFEHSLVS